MLDATARLCAERTIPAQLALEAGMACGFGACYGCVIPTRHGYVRLCLEGPVVDAGLLVDRPRAGARTQTYFAMIELCGIELAHPIINASGTFDAIAAGRAFGDEMLEHFPFAAFVSKTVTVSPASGQPAAAAVGARRRHAQLDRPAEQGTCRIPRDDLPALPSCRSR